MYRMLFLLTAATVVSLVSPSFGADLFSGSGAPDRPTALLQSDDWLGADDSGGTSLIQDRPVRESAPQDEGGESPNRISVSLFFDGAFPLSGSAGAGDGAPDYTDAYTAGLGGGVSAGYRILPCFEARLGGAYQSFTPKVFETDSGGATTENKLSDYTLIQIFLEPRFVFLTDRKVDDWFAPNPKKEFLGVAPYVGFRLGISLTGAVDWPDPAPSWTYWDAGTALLFSAFVGAEYRFIENVGLFLELGLDLLGAPPAAPLAPPNSGMNEAGSMTALGFSAGLTLSF